MTKGGGLTRKFLCLLGAVILVTLLHLSDASSAEDNAVPGKAKRAEIVSDRQAIQKDREIIRAHVKEAKAAESQLKREIEAALETGDNATAEKLKAQLVAMRKANMEKLKEDKSVLQNARQDLREDVRDLRKEINLPYPRKTGQHTAE